MKVIEDYHYLHFGKIDYEASPTARERAEDLAGICGLDGEAYLRDIIRDAEEDPELLRDFVLRVFRSAWEDGFAAGAAAEAAKSAVYVSDYDRIKALIAAEAKRDIERKKAEIEEECASAFRVLDAEEAEAGRSEKTGRR